MGKHANPVNRRIVVKVLECVSTKPLRVWAITEFERKAFEMRVNINQVSSVVAQMTREGLIIRAAKGKYKHPACVATAEPHIPTYHK